jgi:hypothetical protein
MYITVSIGNTDNKLTQQSWNDFVEHVASEIQREGNIHFFGGAPNWERWQNVAWIVEVGDDWDILRERLLKIRELYKQDSIFVLEGKGLFLK